MFGKHMDCLICTIAIILCGLFAVASGKCTGYNSPMRYQNTMGYLTSPKYPSSYMDHENCKFILYSPFEHGDYMIVFEVNEYQTSYVPVGEEKKKCTGHLKFFKDEADCTTEKPFCNAYYQTSNCAKIAEESYTVCSKHRTPILDPAEVHFTSDQYYPQFTPQKGFKLKYTFVDCTPETTTTVTTTTEEETTTPPTTTTVEMTSPEVTTTTQTQEITTSLAMQMLTTNATNKYVEVTFEAPGTFEKQASGPPTWIYAPIVIGIVILLIVVVVMAMRWRKKRKEQISLIAFENPHFNEVRTELREKTQRVDEANSSRRENNVYQLE